MINFQGLAKVLISYYGVSSFCLVIIISTILFYFLGYKRKVKPLILSLNSALSVIREIPDVKSFFSNFRNVDVSLTENITLQHLWLEFKESLILPSPTDNDPKIYNTEESIKYFNEESILSNKVNLRFYNALPNYLTGTGILGTFLGLVAGIYLAGQGLTSDDTQRLTQSLQELLSGASLAFWTSIVGIVMSILFSWREKELTHKLHQLISEWNRELDGRIEWITPESLARKQLEQLNQQTDYLEEFTTKVAFDIAEALDGKLNEKMVPALERLVDSIDKMRNERGDSNEHLIEQLIDKFTSTMSGAAGAEMNALAGTLESLNNTLAPLLEKMNESHRQMQGAAAFISEQIKDSYEKSSEKFAMGMKQAVSDMAGGIANAGNILNENLKGAFEQAIDRLDATVNGLDGSLDKIKETGRNTEQMVIRTGGLLDRFDEIAKSFYTIQSQLNTSLGSLERTAVSIENVETSVKENIEVSSTALSEIKLAVSSFQDVQQVLRESWKEYSLRFEDVDDSLENIFDQIDNGLMAYSEATQEYMGKLDQHAKQVTGLFGGAIQEFSDVVEELSDNIGSIKGN